AALRDLLFVTAQAAAPVLAGTAVVLAPRPHLEDLPVRADRHDDVFHAGGDPAGEDLVGDPADLPDVGGLARSAVAQDALQGEVGAWPTPLPGTAEEVPVACDRLAGPGLARRADVLDHADGHARAEPNGRGLVAVVQARCRPPGQAPPADLRVLCRGQRDAVDVADPSVDGQVFEVGTPAAADVEHPRSRGDPPEPVQDGELGL